ncbi:GntR family transcriptional regulator [Streptomyces lanatus]|uniref:GntR family transcriptional regulator n=1 Tax=Streptomyces lanatus TaxID=66900 RepID=A0ABV1Y4U2_9ACTN|nr:GntR family transcriptional regulator [Streptomyces lanatus]GHH28376.1 GntR family transcriptional regulator [Streptomyces lanatus]
MSSPEVSQVTDSAPVSLADLAYERLRDRLVMLDIRPGEPINDNQLAAEIGVGRTPVREALKRLETDHLVVSYPRRGTFATAIDVTELGAISDIREQLMPFAARRAAVHAGNAMRDTLRAEAEEVRSGESRPHGDRTAMMRTDMSLHRLIYKAAGNPHLEDVLIRYDNLATRIWCLVIDRLPDLAHHITEHADLLDAVADGDADRAEQLTSEHIAGFAREIRGVL